MRLYEIDQAMLDAIDQETGEIMDIEAFERLAMERDAKIDGMICLYKGMCADAAAIASEAGRLKERLASKDHIVSVCEYAIKQLPFGSLNSEGNLQALCGRCNGGKPP